jgi:acetyl esterase/lipase
VPNDPSEVLDRTAPPPDATLPYGPHPEQVVDIRLPAAGSDLPLVILVHGGFWRAAYDRAHIAPLACALAGDGWPVAAIEYRRTGQPGGGWPGTLDDVAAALARTPELVAEACAARDRPAPAGPPVLAGHSAGGHLALWYAATAPAAVRGVLALAPVADLTAAYAQHLGAGAVSDLLDGGPDVVAERYAEADPLARLAESAPVPTVILHGDQDVDVPIGISRTYAAAADAVGARVRLIELSGVEHFALIDPESPVWPSVKSALRAICHESVGIDAPAHTE